MIHLPTVGIHQIVIPRIDVEGSEGTMIANVDTTAKSLIEMMMMMMTKGEIGGIGMIESVGIEIVMDVEKGMSKEEGTVPSFY